MATEDEMAAVDAAYEVTPEWCANLLLKANRLVGKYAALVRRMRAAQAEGPAAVAALKANGIEKDEGMALVAGRRTDVARVVATEFVCRVTDVRGSVTGSWP